MSTALPQSYGSAEVPPEVVNKKEGGDTSVRYSG